jgi:predicted DNA-binding transcriptional regulator AlpA
MSNFVTYNDLKSFGIGHSRASLARLSAVGKFPPCVRLSDRKAVWIRSQIERYVADCVKNSRGARR